MTLKQSDIEALVEIFAQSGWDEVHIEIEGEEILLSSDSRRGVAAAVQHAALAQPVAAPQVAAAAVATASSAAGSGGIAPAPARGANWIAIKADNLGTFYRAPNPEAAPYVQVGSSVTDDVEICMIEVMKLFTTVRAGISGTVREICVKDGQMVEFGQELMWIEPV